MNICLIKMSYGIYINKQMNRNVINCYNKSQLKKKLLFKEFKER